MKRHDMEEMMSDERADDASTFAIVRGSIKAMMYVAGVCHCSIEFMKEQALA